jgi:hypothetical protein
MKFNYEPSPLPGQGGLHIVYDGVTDSIMQLEPGPLQWLHK